MTAKTTERISPARKELLDALLDTDQHDRASVSKEQASEFTKALYKTLNICSQENIKECSNFITKHIAPSPTRTAALIKFFISTSKSLAPRDPKKRIDTTEAIDENIGLGKIVQARIQQPPHPAAKRLFILHILSDVIVKLYLDWFDDESLPKPNRFKKQLFPHLLTLIQLAAYQTEPNNAVTQQIEAWIEYQKLLDIVMFEDSELKALHLAEYCGRNATDWNILLEKITEEEKKTTLRDPFQFDPHWTLPERHGQPHWPKAPPYELPAANGLFLRRKHGAPINMRANPPGGQKIIDAGHEADAELQKDVSQTYTDMIRCFEKWSNPDEIKDIDSLGNKMYHENLGRPTTNYWGNNCGAVASIREIEKDAAERAQGYARLPLQPGLPKPAVQEPRGGYRGGRGGGRGGRGGGGWAPRGSGRVDISNAVERARALAAKANEKEEERGRGGVGMGGGERSGDFSRTFERGDR